MDMDENGNLAVGGTSADTGIVPSANSPLVIYIANTGLQSWAKWFNVGTEV
jgi:hypothetical protein